MPTTNFEIPAFLIHNNIPVYQTYKNDWYDNGPYQYHFSVLSYPENDVDSFDIRNLSSYDPELSIKDNIKKAIDIKTLPIFNLPEDRLKDYLYIEPLGQVYTSKNQDECFMLADKLYTRILNGSYDDAFCEYIEESILNKPITLFLIPEINENQEDGYHLYIYHAAATWKNFYENRADYDLFVMPFELPQAIFIAMNVPYLFEPKDKLQIDMDKLQTYLNQDMIIEFGSIEECMDYFNIYDGQNFKSVNELKAFEQEYGFGIGEKWYHISFDEALDIYKRDKNKSLNTMITNASDRTNEKLFKETHNQELGHE